MAQRKIWKPQEDAVLKYLYDERKIKKWSVISEVMDREYNISGRNGKQCRERYHNHLDHGINKEKWTPEEEQLLVKLHNEYGNRWALISKYITGRTDNCVKNMLYSKLRKAIRFLNRNIDLHFKRKFKQVKINFIYKLIQISEKFYKRNSNRWQQSEKISLQIKNRILNLSQNNEDLKTEAQIEELKDLVEQINKFNKTNKKAAYRKKAQTPKQQLQETQEKNQVKIQIEKPAKKIPRGTQKYSVTVNGELEPLEHREKGDEQKVKTLLTIIEQERESDELKKKEIQRKSSRLSVRKSISNQSYTSVFLQCPQLEQPIDVGDGLRDFSTTPMPFGAETETDHWGMGLLGLGTKWGSF